jgi:hypothetical protein
MLAQLGPPNMSAFPPLRGAKRTSVSRLPDSRDFEYVPWRAGEYGNRGAPALRLCYDLANPGS